MQVEKPKARSVKAKPMKHGSKRKTHTTIKNNGVTGANLAMRRRKTRRKIRRKTSTLKKE